MKTKFYEMNEREWNPPTAAWAKCFFGALALLWLGWLCWCVAHFVACKKPEDNIVVRASSIPFAEKTARYESWLDYYHIRQCDSGFIVNTYEDFPHRTLNEARDHRRQATWTMYSYSIARVNDQPRREPCGNRIE